MRTGTTHQPHRQDRPGAPIGRRDDTPAVRRLIAHERQAVRDTAREVYGGLRRDMKAAGLL